MINSADILNGKILIVDDQQANITLLECMLSSSGYRFIESTTDSRQVSSLQLQNRYDLILLDLQMPCMDGFQVMEDLIEIEIDGYIPVLVITAQPDLKLRAFKSGAKDFISKPFELNEVLARVRNMLEVRLLQKQLHGYNDELEKRVKERTADLQKSYLETIFIMTRAAEHKDEDTGAHVQRISYYTQAFSRMLGMDEIFITNIFFASPMHDIGKIGIPDHILLKPGGFTSDEWAIMQGHVTMGSHILGNSSSPCLKMAAEIALNHHERWDGSGYPDGKRGEEIPLAARIMNICDIYDALRSKRPYKPAFGHQKSLDIIVSGDSRTQPAHFDPAILSAFIQNHESFRAIFDSYVA